MMITRQGLFIPTKRPQDFSKRFTIKHVKGKGDFETITMYQYYRICDKGVYIPRAATKPSKVINGIKSPDITIDMPDVLKPNQKVVVNFVQGMLTHFLEVDKAPLRTGVVIVADTGIGKTYIAMGLIVAFKKTTLYVVNDIKSMWQVVKTLREHLKVSVGVYYGEKRERGDIVVGVINSLLKADSSFFTFGTVIYDEVDEYVTPLRHDIFFKANTVFNVGMTATPKEGVLAKITEDCIGPLLYADKVPGYVVNDVVFKGYVRRHNIKIEPLYDRGHVSFLNTIKSFANNEELNNLILNEIKYLLELGKNIYIFSEIKSYLYHLFDLVDEDNKMILVGGASPEDLEKAKTVRLVFITYKYGQKALSLEDKDAIIFVTPRHQAKQATGRILRINGNLLSCRYVSDIVHSCFASQFRDRLETYNERNFEVITIK